MDDLIVYSSELQYDVHLDSTSTVMRSVRAFEPRWPMVYARQQVRSFERGALEVRSSDWVIACASGESMVGRVGEIVEFSAAGGISSLSIRCAAGPVHCCVLC